MLYDLHLLHCESHGLTPCSQGSFYKRIIEGGRSKEKAIETPVMSRGGARNNKGYKEKYIRYLEICEEIGVDPKGYKRFCNI